MTVVGALLARNEAAPDRYLRRALRNAAQFCDEIVVVDDGSTDETAAVCAESGCEVLTQASSGGYWGKDETTLRERLWNAAAQKAGPNGWIYVFDADHELVGITPEDFATLCKTTTYVSWAFPLLDCWDSDTLHRVDGYWQAWCHPRPWLFRTLPTPNFMPEWRTPAGIHSGHSPANFPPFTGVAPGLAAIRHLGYLQREHRVTKHAKYTALEGLSDFERAHAESILEEPTLVSIPTEKKPKVLIGSIVRKPPEVVEALIKTLQWQETGFETDIHFITNYAQGEAELPLPEEISFEAVEAPLGDYGEGGVTRSWSEGAYGRVATMKDSLIAKALAEDYDYLWLVDADVMCDPHTLQCLIDSDAAIVSGVYWTNWQLPKEGDNAFVHAGPQVWQRGQYGMDSLTMTAEEFRERLVNRARLPVAGLGACTLIRQDALEKGVSFSHYRPAPMGPGGMAEGEDRHFCARAHALHIDLVADAWSDIYHAYHPAEYDKLPEMLEALEAPHHKIPVLGDLVSVVVEHLEPVVDKQGRAHKMAPQYIRGKFGALPLLPELEEAAGGLKVGDETLTRVHFPAHYEVQSLRGQTRILRVSLLDAKSFAYAPTIDAELFKGKTSKRHIDATALLPPQVADILEEA